MKIGSGSGAYDSFYIFGSDNYPAKGGWQILPISVSVAGYRDATTGSPTRTGILYWSLLGDFTATSKSENVVIDAIDLGVGLCIVGGDGASADAELSDLVTFDEGTSGNRYGYITSEANGSVAFIIGTLAIGQTSAGTSTLTEWTERNESLGVAENGPDDVNVMKPSARYSRT